MERWEIRPSPNADDPQRHLLLLRGGVSDVAAVLKKFGALCGRPTPLDGEEFNLSFVLHNLTPEVRGKLDEWLSLMAPKPVAPPPTPAPASAPPPATAPPSALPPMPSLAPAPTPALGGIPPAALSSGLPPPPPPPATPSLGIPSAATLPPPKDILPPIPLPPGDGAAIPPPPQKEPLISLGPETPPLIPPAPASATPPPPTVSSFPTEVRMATPPKPAEATPALAPAASGATLTDELRPDWNFETLLVGAYNRFAHAASMSVVSSPGTMYNPLFLYGVPGTGKSHLLHAIATSMSKGLGTASILVTSGSRLSRAVSAAVAAKNMAAIDKKVADSKALFIDDIHLLALTDQNKDALAKIFKSFFDRSQQVVLTSMYPPKALGAIEEALKFQFSKGWSVDLKIPNPNVQRDLVSSVSDRMGTQLGGDEIGQLADKLTLSGYSDLALWAKRLAVLKRVRTAAGQPVGLMDHLRLIYEPIMIGTDAPPPNTASASFAPPAPGPDAEPIAVLVPKGFPGLAAFACSLFYDIGSKNGFNRTYRHVLTQEYDASQQVGVPFQIADMCGKAGVTRAIVIGPGPESPLAARVNEFGHAVRHILESNGILTGWVPFNGLQIGGHYLNAHLDFEK